MLWNYSSVCAYLFQYLFTNSEVKKDGEVGAEGSKWKMFKTYILKYFTRYQGTFLEKISDSKDKSSVSPCGKDNL